MTMTPIEAARVVARIAELEAEYETAQSVARAKQRELINYIVEQSGWKINDQIEFGKTTRTIGRVVAIIPFIGADVRLRVVTQKKNSEWGKVEQSVYSDENIIKLPA